MGKSLVSCFFWLTVYKDQPALAATSSYDLHCESKKTRHQTFANNFTNYQIWTDFQTCFTDGLGSKFATQACFNIPTCLKRVATLPCEIWKSEKCRQSEICIVINDKSHGSIAKNLKSDELYFTTHLSFNLPVKEFLKLVNIWLCYRQSKMVHCFMPAIRLALLSSKMLISPDKLNDLCITDRNCY